MYIYIHIYVYVCIYICTYVHVFMMNAMNAGSFFCFNNIRKVEHSVNCEGNAIEIGISCCDSSRLWDGGAQNVRVSRNDG